MFTGNQRYVLLCSLSGCQDYLPVVLQCVNSIQKFYVYKSIKMTDYEYWDD